jgi:hypothetical protein
MIYGDRMEGVLVALVLPTWDALTPEMILADFVGLAADHNLQPWEVIRAVVVAAPGEEWTSANGLLTSTGKAYSLRYSCLNKITRILQANLRSR